jgi:hypothetical protein
MAAKMSNEPRRADGRRVYIHKYGFRCLILQTPDIGPRLCEALALVRAAKVINHHLADTGGMLGLVRESIAKEFIASLPWSDELTSLLRDIAFRPSFPRDRGVALPVLVRDERIFSTCTEAGYYTFATDEESSERMFADHQPMPTLQRSLAAGQGPADLTIIKGRSLIVIDPRIGVGRVGHRYSAALASQLADADHAAKIDTASRASCLMRVQDIATSMSPRVSDDERRAFDEMTAALSRSFQVLNSI